MDIIHHRCAGIDISKADAKVAVRIAQSGVNAKEEVRTFGSTTRQVLELRDWLIDAQVTCVVMEATGDYWRTFYYLLEDAGFELLLANPRDVRNRPGRKSDVSDCKWLADLGAHGLVGGSFVPPAPIRDLRALTRLRTCIARDRGIAAQRLEKVLEGAGIKLSTVTDPTNVSSRRMLQGLAEGMAVEDLVEMAYGALRRKKAELVEALTGQFSEHHTLMVNLLLDRIDSCNSDIKELTERIELLMQPYQRAHDLLVTIPGVSDTVADVIIAETGADMTVFPTAKHLASWAGAAPGMNQSGARTKPAKKRPGNTHLQAALGIIAFAATKTRKTYLSAQYRRITAHRGPMKAMVAVQNSAITAVWHMLTNDKEYVDPGPDYYTQRRPDTTRTKAIQQLQNLGYQVTLTTPKEPEIS